MADESRLPKVGDANAQAEADKFFAQKAEQLRVKRSKKLLALKGRNKIVGLLLTGGVFGIYGYTMFSVRQGKMLEAFDKVPE